MTTDCPRLIEHAFPLKQASLDSVHEKNVRHGHISTLHIWPARRPLAACRAALIATLLPDPGTPEKRKEVCEKIGGKVVKKIERKKMPNGQIVEREKEVTEGGILHWGRERENKEVLDWFRQEIRKAYGGRAPKVLDPFAGGGAIPLEAMRLGCEATAIDINPVAWFILKCTLEYPQKLAGETWPLPDFILENEGFMEAFYKAHPHLVGRTKKTQRQKDTPTLNFSKTTSDRVPKADLVWHVRAWGQWVLNKARRELARYYPVYADFEPLDPRLLVAYEKQPLRPVPLKDDGTPNIDELNKDFSKNYLANKGNPRWVVKPTVAYLWARAVKCKNCRATIPLLKTRWLCKRDKKRVLLTMEPNTEKTGVTFGIEKNVPVKGGNTAQRREHDKRIGKGTMSRSGAKCPCCSAIMTMEDIRLEGQAGRLSEIMTAVVVDGQKGKEYRLPVNYEIEMALKAEKALPDLFAKIPFGLPEEPTPKGGSGASRAFSVDGYGFNQWKKLFTPRQLLALGTFVKWTGSLREELAKRRCLTDWVEAIAVYLAIPIDKVAAFNCTITRWFSHREGMCPIFSGYRIEMMWDYGEINPLSQGTGAYGESIGWLTRVVEVISHVCTDSAPSCQNYSVLSSTVGECDIVLTDPPYYDAIPYSDCMDFFYVWLRRSLHGLSRSFDDAFHAPLSPKWDSEKGDGELIDDASVGLHIILT
jgi:putative DNA methylase